MKRALLLLMLISCDLVAQDTRDSILIMERSIDRPITVHKGQIRITGGYGLNIISKRYDEDGEKIKLNDEGLSSVRHHYQVDIKYGVLEFLEVQATVGRKSQAIRNQTYIIIDDPFIYATYTQDIIGMEDVFLGLNLRYPFKSRMFDVMLMGGMSLPTANHSPDKPSHKLVREVDVTGETWNVDFHYNENWGNGVPVMQFGGMAKYRRPNTAFSAQAIYRLGTGEGETYDWDYTVNSDDTFSYSKVNYTYELPTSLTYYAEAEYQPKPWFNLILNVSGFLASGGNKDGDEFDDSSLLALNPGFEILVTPKLWLRQRMTFPVYGMNTEGGFSFFTTISYNFFPF